MRILISNDDGIRSPGLEALAEALRPLGEVWVVAPDRERSAASHSISLHRPLRIIPIQERVYAVDGTPSDCVYLAVNHLLKDKRPDLVVSGINLGANIGDDISYSGTVAAATEATLMRIPAVAFSLCGSAPWDFSGASRFAVGLVESLQKRRLPPGVLLNVNVPNGNDGSRYRITRQGKRSYGAEVVEKRDPRGRPYYWIAGDELDHENVPGSDANTVYDEGLISVTPLHLNMTHDPTREEMLAWEIPGATRKKERQG